MKFEIKHRFSGAVLFAIETDSMRLCVEAAVRARADLAGAYLARANLADAYLARADLAGADLAGAYLAGANLADAYLARANLAAQLGQPNGWHAWTYCDKDGNQRVRVGCRDFTIAEGRKYWAGKEDRREVLAALNYAEAIWALRKWGESK